MSERDSIHAPAPVEYREIPGFGGYRVGSDGTVWSQWDQRAIKGKGRGFETVQGNTWRLLSPSKNSEGYLTVRLASNGKSKTFSVHVLVLSCFAGPCPPGMEGCHFPDRSRENCRANNLRWDTRQSNQRDRVAHGTAPKGEGHGRAKLTIADVRKIRELAATLSQPEIASQFGISRSAVGHIIARRNWRDA